MPQAGVGVFFVREVNWARHERTCLLDPTPLSVRWAWEVGAFRRREGSDELWICFFRTHRPCLLLGVTMLAEESVWGDGSSIKS